MTAEGAKHDQIGIEFGRWALGASDMVSFAAFFALLTTPTHDNVVLSNLSRDLDESWFTRRSGPAFTNQTLIIRQGGRGRGLRQGRPIAAGELKTRTVSRPDNAPLLVQHVREVRLDAKLNATRFVQYQPRGQWTSMRTLPPAQWTLPPAQLVTGVPTLSDLDERSLDGNDNVLMGRAAITYARNEAWPIHLARYWHAITAKIDDVVRHAASNAGLCVMMRPELNLKTLETYWEFAVEDPAGWVRENEPVIRTIGHSSEARSFAFPDGLAIDSIEGNSRSLTARIRPGITLRVYAKTTRRVRMEIIHDFRENAAVLGGRHTSTDQQALFTWLQAATESATTELNQVLNRLERSNTRSGEQVSVPQLVTAITQAVGDDLKATDILALLVANGSLIVTIGSGLQAAVRKLKAREIIEPTHRGSSMYVLAPRFRAAGRRLSDQSFPR